MGRINVKIIKILFNQGFKSAQSKMVEEVVCPAIPSSVIVADASFHLTSK
jgi:hypothetical protein